MPSQDRRTGDGTGFCKAGIQSIGDTDTRKGLASPSNELSINRQLEVLCISKGAYYYQPKGENVYINPTDNIKELREGIKNYIEYYNTKRPHQGIEHQIPMTKYAKIAA